MSELKLRRDTKVILCLTEDEAARLAAMMFCAIDFDSEPLASELHESITSAEIASGHLEYRYNERHQLFELRRRDP